MNKEAELVALARSLIKIPTINPPGENYEKLVEILEKRCRAIGLKTRRIIVPKTALKKHGITTGSKRIVLLARWDVGAKKTLHINGHYDVVPVTSRWTQRPFDAASKNGCIYGRGAEDMKGNIAAFLFAVETLKRSGIKPNVNVELSFVPDEETGGATGMGYLFKRGLIKCDYALGEGYSKGFVSVGNKGMLWLKVTVLGKSAHGSEPYKGVNSFERMVEAASQLKKLERKVSRRKTRYHVRERQSRFASLVMGGAIEGGMKVNIVPDESSFTIDRRILPEETVSGAYKEILDCLNELKRKHKDFKFKIEVLAKEEPVVVKSEKPFSSVVKDVMHHVLKKEPKLAIMPGGTDLRYFIRKGIPAYGFSIDGGERYHGDDEFIYVKSLIDTAKIYEHIIADVI